MGIMAHHVIILQATGSMVVTVIQVAVTDIAVTVDNIN
jgi:hypothetical protein